MDPRVSVQKQKLHKKPREACKSSWNPRGNLKSFTLTNSLEFGKSCGGIILESLYVNTTQIRNTWIAERAVPRVKEETSAVLLLSGLDREWWADSMECFCYLRNIQDLL